MEWWEQVAWGDIATWAGVGAAFVAAVIALVFGIRAELRDGYRPLWVVLTDGRLVNRTREDASEVWVMLESATEMVGSYKFSSVAPDEVIQLPAWELGAAVTVTWLRPSTVKLYVWPWTRISRRRARRLRRHVKRLNRQHNRQARRRGQLWPHPDS